MRVSVAVHRSDNAVLDHPAHCASAANAAVYSVGLKSKSTRRLHMELHQMANSIKHAIGHSSASPPTFMEYHNYVYKYIYIYTHGSEVRGS